MRRSSPASILIGVLALAVGACGGFGTDSDARPAPAAAGGDVVQQAVQSEIDSSLREDIYTAAVVVIRRGNSRQVIAGGVTDTRTTIPVTERDRFFIGSVSKTVLATAVLQLVEQDRLGLDDNVDQWLPGLLADGGAITIRQLLSHTSGLANYTDDAGLMQPRQNQLSPVQLVELAESMPSMFDPGMAAAYSNTNFVVLGLIVEKVTRGTLARVLHEAVFQPLGLSSASSDAAHLHDPPLVHAYADRRDATPPSWMLPLLWGAGGIVMSPHDLDKFLQALFDGSLLTPSSLKSMTTRRLHDRHGWDYGLGLAQWDTGCGLAYGHDGDAPGGYITQAWIIPSEQRSVVVTVNASGSGPYTSAMSLAEDALCS
jgi:D-alanyl-D-alanine carboxypeptidase